MRRVVLFFIFIRLCVPSFADAILQPTSIRVRILRTKHAFILGCSGDYSFAPLSGGKARSFSQSSKVKAGYGKLMIGSAVHKAPVLVAPVQPSDHLYIDGRHYRGVLVLHPLRSGYIDVVNQLSPDDYLYAVLPREVGADWPLEALKSQAIVSRTYVLANLSKDPDDRFDVSNNVTHQVYGSLEDERPTSNRAVDETRGVILVDSSGKPFQTFFHSSCGGMTETPDNVWYKHPALDPFASVKDEYCQKEDPYRHWQIDLSPSQIRARLKNAGYRVGDIIKISAARKSVSGRTTSFLVQWKSGKREIPGNRFRIAMGADSFRSTLLLNISKPGRSFRFEGRGWGHGVGLCQWGARGRALVGDTAESILKTYYPHARLAKMTVGS